MKRILATAFFVATTALASPWTGRLVDATCYDAAKQTEADKCKIMETTTAFGVVVDGKVYKLDPSGNSQTAEILKTQPDHKGHVMVRVTGELDGDVIAVKTIEIQR